MKTPFVISAIVCGVLALLVNSLYRQSRAADDALRDAQYLALMAKQESLTKSFEEKFWDYLVENKFRNWAPVPGKSDDFFRGESPHGAFLKMYLSRGAAGSPSDLPVESILVKENYADDRTTLDSITIMYRIEGYDSEHGNWFWAKYKPDGTLAQAPEDKGGAMLAGKVEACIQCHSGANGDDYVFFNDGPK